MEGAALIERVQPGSRAGRPGLAGDERLRPGPPRPAEPRRRRGTRLVALSGYGQDSDIQAALEAGFDEHLTKPPDPIRLQQLLLGGPRRKGGPR